jgi:potassium efflux system protein
MTYKTYPQRLPLNLLLASWLLCLFFFPASALAQPTGATETTKSPLLAVSIDTVKLKLDALETKTGIDKKTLATLDTLYRRAISNLENAISNEQATLDFIKAEKEDPAKAKALHQKTVEKQKVSPESFLKQYANFDLDKLQSLLLKEKADLAAVNAKLTKANESLKFHTERPQAIRQQLIEVNRMADGIASKLQNPVVVADELPAVTEARRWVKESEAMRLGKEISMLDQELLSHPARLELLKAEVEKAEHSALFVETKVEQLERLVNDKRQVKASQVKAKAELSQQLAEGEHPLVQQLAEKNTELSRNISEITTELKKTVEEDNRLSKWVERINLDYKSAKQKLEIAGMSKILGKVLREQSHALPDTGQYRKKAKQLEDKIADVSLQQIEYREELEKLSDLDVYIDQYLFDAEPALKLSLKEPISQLASDRADYLEQIIAIQGDYIRAMSELDFSQTRLLEAAVSYDEYLDEHLLWIRSAPPFSLKHINVVPRQVQSLLSPAHWLEVLDALWKKATSHIYMLLTLIVVTTLLWKERYMRAALHSTAKYIGKPTKDSIKYTVQGIAWTLLLASAWPLLMLSLGLQLHDSNSPTAFTRAVSQALILVAEGLFILRSFALLCSKNGVAALHFKWPPASLKLLRRDINILIYTFLPLGFIDIIVINSNLSDQGVGLGRVAFILMMFALTLFFYRVLNPTQGALQASIKNKKFPTLAGVRYGWLILAVLLPITAAVLAAMGYLYTAGSLVKNLVETFWLLLLLLTVQQFVVRWLLVVRGKLALKAAKEKREALRLAALAQQEDSTSTNETLHDIEEPEIDIEALREDSLKLLNLTMVILGVIGTWGIWSDILPAFNIFNRFPLYQHKVDIAGEITYKAVTLGDVGQVILIVLILTLLIRRLPALLEILLRQSSSISTGSLYAVKSLTSYALIAVGVVLVFGRLGGTWSEIQWVFAALGVGIGFGLQEIVANFISGLIILFERPIRVGDMVTVGNVSGTVTRIQIRATTIRDLDKKELLVPNKEFITGQLLNWSLSDTVTRLSMSVGIAYGSDVALALKLIQEATTENEKIMDDPAPVITFDSFGDNALTLTARVFIDNLDHRLATISELHSAINDKFNKAGIVIAFPQRDVHLDTSQPLEIRIKKDHKNEE